jgi:HSP20 family molecular chaperone IbpA
MREVYESISRRAYAIFEARGHQHGRDVEDWLRAESELLWPVPVEIRESSKQLTVRAEVPGFSAQEIEISLEPRQLFISGKRAAIARQKTDETAGTEKGVKEIFRAIVLPAGVDPLQVTATFKDAVVEVTLPKVDIRANPFKALVSLPFRLMLASMNPPSAIYRALVVNPGSWLPLDDERVYARNLEVPSGGGVGTARAMAWAYSVFATGGRELGLRQETLQALSAPAIPSAHGFYDEALKGEIQFSLGFMKSCPNWPFGHAGAFGSPGAGGSLGFADPQTGMAYAYLTNRMGGVTGDPRDLALRNAIPQGLK